ncbi:conserved hypothetical protein [Vibrio phage 424E50-1]|nr:conserved hypothetical protein [Vibrio phage 424E50-1]
MAKNITELVEVFELSTTDQAILRKGNFDRRISLELAGTLSWAKRNGYTYLGEHAVGLTFTNTNSFSTYQGLAYFSLTNGYVSTSTNPVTEGNLFLKNEDWILAESFRQRVGQKVEIHSSQVPSWLLKADGATVSRGVDSVLWDHAANSGLVIGQATKDADPVQYAMYYGDGDGTTTFSLPNWYLGHFARGNPSGVALGETQVDAIRNITGTIGELYGDGQTMDGAFQITSSRSVKQPTGTLTSNLLTALDFNASRVVETADENRPKTGHINVCIERGINPV